MRRGGRWLLVSFSMLAFAAGCAGNQSALSPGGVQASRIYNLWQVFAWVTAAVYVLTMAWVIIAFTRRPRHREEPVSPLDDKPLTSPDPRSEARGQAVVWGLITVTTVILFGLLVGDFYTGRQIHTLPNEGNELSVKIIGHQWWWEVQYEDATASNFVTTANELHIPVGTPVGIKLDAADVIHSFWVPNLNGKKDMVPGHPTMTWIRADKPGTYVGQCAEFCGLEHAKMRFTVIAEPRDQYDAWIAAHRQTPPPPTDSIAQRGQQVFLSSSCVMCHNIQGTPAKSRLGPDLTDIGGRKTIGAGWLPNTPENMGEWISHTQDVKPGVRMPPTTMPADDLHALVTYLESLK